MLILDYTKKGCVGDYDFVLDDHNDYDDNEDDDLTLGHCRVCCKRPPRPSLAPHYLPKRVAIPSPWLTYSWST